MNRISKISLFSSAAVLFYLPLFSQIHLDTPQQRYVVPIITADYEDDNDSVLIGGEAWLSQNLNVSTFRNGDIIMEAKTHEEWMAAAKNNKPVWCHYNNDPANAKKYGKIYNWYAVSDARGLAPAGYHIPDDEDWIKLITSLGWEEKYGEAMKSKMGWIDSSNGTNSSGFNAHPGGCRDSSGVFSKKGSHACWWSITDWTSPDHAQLLYDLAANGLIITSDDKYAGFSVRCVKDRLKK